MPKKKKAWQGRIDTQYVGFRATKEELEDMRKMISIVKSREDYYGALTLCGFCKTVVLNETNKILKKGK